MFDTLNFGLPELLIILIIVVLLFGAGRVGKIGGELGEAVANFRNGMKTNAEKTEAPTETSTTNA
jgi:sec-independent protein translocase protein TatA